MFLSKRANTSAVEKKDWKKVSHNFYMNNAGWIAVKHNTKEGTFFVIFDENQHHLGEVNSLEELL